MRYAGSYLSSTFSYIKILKLLKLILPLDNLRTILDVMANLQDCENVLSEFQIWGRYYIQ